MGYGGLVQRRGADTGVVEAGVADPIMGYCLLEDS